MNSRREEFRGAIPWPWSYRHDNLADLLVRFQVALCLRDLCKRKRLRNHRLQMAQREPLQNELAIVRKALRPAPDRRGYPTAQAEVFQRHRPMRIRRRLAAQSTIDEDDAVLRRGESELLNIRTAHRIENDARAFSSGDA